MRKKNEINEYMNEAFDVVWFVRTIGLLSDGSLENTPEDIINEVKRNVERICQSHGIKNNEDVFEFCDEWKYGYWSGILAALRWVMGEEKDSLDT